MGGSSSKADTPKPPPTLYYEPTAANVASVLNSQPLPPQSPPVVNPQLAPVKPRLAQLSSLTTPLGSFQSNVPNPIVAAQSKAPAPSTTAPAPPPPVKPNPIYPANITVTHDINEYIVHKNEAPNCEVPALDGVPLRKRVNRHQLRVCMIYNSRKSLCLTKCHRFHVCLSWIVGKCENSDCQFNHDFNSAHNSNITRHVIFRHFGEGELIEQLKKNCDFAKKFRTKMPFNICPFFVNHICRQDKCQQIHFKEKYSWEIKGANWLKFTQKMSTAIEKMYCNPENESYTFKVSDFDFPRNAERLYDIIGSGDSFTIDFESMNLTVNGATHSVKRLTTPSDVHTTLSANTRWLWYVKRGVTWDFLEHGQFDNFYNLSLSDFFEFEYQKSNATLQLDKTLVDFSQMTMTKDAEYGCSSHVKLRRRPAFIHNPYQFNSEVSKFRDMWSGPSSDEEIYSKENLETGSYEFNMVKGFITSSMFPNKILNIERIQNPNLWKKYQLKRRQLLIENDGEEGKLKEQYMFHGTKIEVLDPICQQNLDWRLYATNVGCLYGQGTYFTDSASVADGYASGSPKVMLVVMVLIGDACKGDSSMSLPPENTRTDRPYDTTVNKQSDSHIFVKYNNDEYYPAYAVHYNW